MFLKCRERRKDGKVHRSWSIVESRRCADRKVVHRHVLYLGEINDSQRAAWERSIAVIDERDGQSRQMALFPSDRTPPPSEVDALQVRLSGLRLSRPRQWGACWLADQLWRTLHLDNFFGARLHRHWFETTALPDLLGVGERSAQDDTLYRCHDLLLEHKEALFGHLRGRWADLFGVRYEVLLYDLTSTYFECDVPNDTRKRFATSDCVHLPSS
jgi:hypothetical protein